MKSVLVGVVLIAGMGWAQNLQPPATIDETKYLRFVLLNVASLDNSSSAIKSYEDHLVKLHGLNAEESAVIHAAGQVLKPLLAQLRESAHAISAANQTLAPPAIAALNEVEARREQKVAELANQILNAVRPETADRLRTPGRLVAARSKKL
jgi:hypothetical protein